MLKNIYLYLFIFTAITALAVYINARGYQENLENRVKNLSYKLTKTTDELELLKEQQQTVPQQLTSSDMVFSTEGNQLAADYFERYGLSTAEAELKVKDAMLELGNGKDPHPLIQYESQNAGGFLLNDIHLLNNKWLIANYSDGDQWGEMLVQFFFNEDGTIDFEVLKSLIYPIQ